ncbi:MAG: alpha-amylase, partial [Candidatus Izimaplasma sp.]|nr:alpha-amylase [Candidatus Izimaplasma bacterium]
EGALHEYMYNSVKLPLPVFACGETHDTPRLASRNGNEQLAKMLTVINMFMPNGVPFINSGQEVFERQPMNTGLDCSENEQYSLDRDDPYNGKLALFDKYQFHYTNNRRWELPDILDFLKPIRKKWLKQITNKKSFIPIYSTDHSKMFIGLAYYKKNKLHKNNCLLILANGDPFNQQILKPDITKLRSVSKNTEMIGKLLFSTHEDPRKFTQFDNINTIDLHLGSGEIKIIEF